MMFFSKQNQRYIAISSRVSIVLAVATFVAAIVLTPANYKSEIVVRIAGTPTEEAHLELETDLREFIADRQNQKDVGLRLLAHHLTVAHSTERINAEIFKRMYINIPQEVRDLRAETQKQTYFNLYLHSDTIPYLKTMLNRNPYYGYSAISSASVGMNRRGDGVVLSYKSDDEIINRQTLFIIFGLYKDGSDRQYSEHTPQSTLAVGSIRMVILWTLLAALSGFMLTMAAFALKNSAMLSKKLKTPKIAAQRTGLEVMGVLPQDDLIASDQTSLQIKNKLLYHMLLSVLQNTEAQQQKILITSIYPEEGKEFVSNIICEWLYRKGKQCMVVAPFHIDDYWWLKHQDAANTERITVEMLAKKDVIIMVLPPLIEGDLPIELIRDFDMAYLVCSADRKWSPNDQMILDYFMEQSEQFLQIILNKANMNVVDEVLKQINVTHFASAERSSQRMINREHKAIMNNMQVNKIMKDVPNLGVILDKNRQIVYANEAITSLLGLSNMDKTLGMRPGELVSCIYSDVTTGGCGTAKACQDCGAVGTILKCLETRQHEEGTCDINSFLGGQLVPFKFKISCSPFQAKDGEFFVIANLADIKGDEDKRKELENKAKKTAQTSHEQMSALNEFVEKVDGSGQLEALMDTIKGNEETIEFKRLVSAENGTLKLQPDRHSAFVLVENAVRAVREKPFAKDKIIELAPPFPSINILTDAVVFEQTLRTMLRNALEAEPEGEKVYIGYEPKDKFVSFYVYNKTPIPAHLQKQIFEKGFTTKMSRRGLGTYTVKVFAEQYLIAKVGFNSDEATGTRFFLTLPISS